MALIDLIDIDDIHNEIAMDNTGSSVNVIVEGFTDAELFDGLFSQDRCNIYCPKSKEMVLELMRRLESEDKYSMTIAIVDDDHDELFGKQRPQHTFRTDTNDIETMILKSDAFYTIARGLYPRKYILNNESIDRLRESIIQWALPMGELRLTARLNNWPLSFKDRIEIKGQGVKARKVLYEFKMKNYMDSASMTYTGDDKFVSYVILHTDWAGVGKEEVLEKLSDVRSQHHTPYEIIIGHDVSRVIALSLSKKYKKDVSENLTESQIELTFRVAYCKEFFRQSKLYDDIVATMSHVAYDFV